MGEEKKGNTTDAAHGILVLPDDAQCFSVKYSAGLIIYIYIYETCRCWNGYALVW